MGKGSTSYGTTTGTGSSAPWQPQQGPIQQGIAGAQNLYGQNPGAELTQQGVSGIAQTAGSSTLPQTSADFLSNTLTNPKPNEYIDKLSTSIGNQIVPQVMSNFALAGRAGDSPLAQAAVGQGIATGLAPYMFGSAENQMNRQMDALAMSPQIEAARYGPSNALIGAGQTQANQAWGNLGNFMNTVGQPYGSETSSNVTAPFAHTDTSGFRAIGK